MNQYKVYVLLLQKDKFYVGLTSRQDYSRVQEHFSGQGSEWTKMYKPVKLLEEFYENITKESEQYITYKYMHMYGVENVRGGANTKRYMTQQEIQNLQQKVNDMEFTSDEESYQDSESSSDYDDNEDYCFRCGRQGHWIKDCYAKKHVNGNYLS